MATEQVSWQEFLDKFNFLQGEHITAIGHTGCGKTTLTNQLIERRKFVAFLASKKKDSTVDWLKKNQGFIEQKRFLPERVMTKKKGARIIVRPNFPIDVNKMLYEHYTVFREVINTAYVNGCWCLDTDELRYLSKELGLAKDLERIWLQGRSLKVSLVGCTQTPKWIPTSAYSQPTHLFFWKDNDASNLKRLREINAGHLDPKMLEKEIAALPLHEFIYAHRDTGMVLRSKVEI